jgi:hypothetical protein
MNWTDFVIKAFLKFVQLIIGLALTVFGFAGFFTGQGTQLTLNAGNAIYFLSLCVGMGFLLTLIKSKRR